MSAEKPLPEFLRRKTPEQQRVAGVGRFQSLQTITSVLQGTNVIALFTVGAMAVTLFSLQSHLGSDSDVAAPLLANGQMLQVCALVVSVVNAIAFGVWTHRAYNNLPALGHTRCTYSPNVAVTLLFIPLVNVFVLLRVFNELADGSDPGNLPNRSRRSGGPNLLVLAWWVTWLLSVALYIQISLTYSPLEKTHSNATEYLGYTAWLVTGSLIPTALGIVVFAVISANQQSRHLLVSKAPLAAESTVDMSFLKE